MFRQIKHKITGGKIVAALVSLGLSVFLIAFFIFGGLSHRPTFADPVSGKPLFDKLLPAGALLGDGSVVELADAGRPAFMAGYSLGSQSGLALVVWDAAASRFGVAANRLFTKNVSGSAAQPPTLSLEPLGEEAPTIVAVHAAIGNNSEGASFVRWDGQRLNFVEMTDGGGQTKSAFFAVGDFPVQNEASPGLVTLNSASLLVQDVDQDGVKEAAYFSRSFEVSESGGGWSTSVDVYSWQDGRFVFNKELSYLLTRSRGMFPEPPAQ